MKLFHAAVAMQYTIHHINIYLLPWNLHACETFHQFVTIELLPCSYLYSLDMQLLPYLLLSTW